MNIYWKLYWLTRLDSLNGMFNAILTIGIAMMVLFYFIKFINHIEGDDNEIYTRKNRWKIIWAFILIGIAIIGITLTPSKNEAILIIAGGKTIDWISKDTSICKIPSQTSELVSSFLDKQIKELSKEEKSEK